MEETDKADLSVTKITIDPKDPNKATAVVKAKTGEHLWTERGFPMASIVHADGKLIILDENGQLTLATATPKGLTIRSQSQITEKYSLTAPALAGTKLFVQDRKQIVALELG